MPAQVWDVAVYGTVAPMQSFDNGAVT